MYIIPRGCRKIPSGAKDRCKGQAKEQGSSLVSIVSGLNTARDIERIGRGDVALYPVQGLRGFPSRFASLGQ